MSQLTIKIIRIALGLFMILIGLNKFLEFTEIPNPSGDGGTLMKIYISSGFLKLIGVLEAVGGIGLILIRYLPVSLTVLTAIMFNALVFHILHDPVGLGPALICLLLCLLLFFHYRCQLKSFFRSQF